MTALPPPFIYIHIEARVAICTEHGSSYTKTNLRRHLRDAHLIRSSRATNIAGYVDSLPIAESIGGVTRPRDGSSPFPGLPIHSGFKCSATDGVEVDSTRATCRFITTHEPIAKLHRWRAHKTGASVRERQREGEAGRLDGPSAYQPVRVQTLFAGKKHVDYFTVEVDGDRDVPSTGEQADQQLLIEATARRRQQPAPTADTVAGAPILIKAAADHLLESFRLAQDERVQRYTTVESIEHISELTAFLRVSGYQAHLEGVEIAEIGPARRLPVKDEEPVLWVACSSVERLLRTAMDTLGYNGSDEKQLSKLHARLLNTFLRSQTTQDPIRPLQNSQSKGTYIATLQRLFCYYSRVVDRTCLRGKHMFEPTLNQASAWSAVKALAEAVVVRRQRLDGTAAACNGSSISVQRRRLERDEELSRLEEQLDRSCLAFGLELVQHRLQRRAFDSAIVSFAAVSAWNDRSNSWSAAGSHSSTLAQIVYDVQLLLLQRCVFAVEEDDSVDFTSLLVDFRDQWLLNDTEGPMCEILLLRLHIQQIARSVVAPAQIRWKADGETIVYQDIELPMQSVRDLVRHELAAATAVFEWDLCLGQADIPRYKLARIVDNWDARSPGASFTTDARNATLLGDGERWLFHRLTTDPELSELLLYRSRSGGWHVRSDAVQQYEAAVQRFLEHLCVVIHLSSGQPARGPELLGLRWCNKQADVRNVFVHDGHALFILSYHKALNVTSAARFPVRVLLPRVGELLVQYLVLVIPFRTWLLSSVKGSSPVSEYLWADDSGVWSENRIAKTLASASKSVIGVRLGLRSWRQIAVGIAIKKLSGAGYPVADEGEGDGGDDDEDAAEGRATSTSRRGGGGGAMPEALHWQASHTPLVGNRAYGGTVNFRGGLTDAALQEYLRVSRLWHRFIERDGTEPLGAKHSRGESGDALLQPPLAKRLAARGTGQRCRRHWTMEEARVALCQMYGPFAAYKTLKQEQAVQAVVSGVSPIVAVLGTGEGKSLLYLLQQRLPGAGTTVVIVPLLALKQDTIRRCNALGVHCRVWGEGPSHDGYGLGNALVIVSLEQAVGLAFRAFLHGLSATGQLGSVVLDECHLVLTASGYREDMEKVKELRKVDCQLVLLTATLPVCMASELHERLLLPSPVTIRGLTVRKDIDYRAGRTAGPDLVAAASSRIREAVEVDWFVAETAARAIVYCRTKAEVEEVAAQLRCPYYYSDSGSSEQKAEAVESWAQGLGGRTIVATSALAEGVDYPCVRLVFHVDAPRSAVEFVQCVGRGGRDGRGCVSCVLLPARWQAKTRATSGELLAQDEAVMQRFLDSPRCRLLPLGSYLDGVVQFCDGEEHACDRCTELGLVEGSAARAEAEREYDRKGGRGLGLQTTTTAGEEPGTGARLDRERTKEAERRRRAFVRNLETVRGLCVICLAKGEREGRGHGLEGCRSVAKWEFIGAKRRAIEEAKRRGGEWIAKYHGCFGCGLGQEMCARQGKGGCRYRDVVMPLSWSAFRVERWREQVEKLRGRQLRGEAEYMAWLGLGAEVFGEKGNNMVVVCERVLEQMVKEMTTTTAAAAAAAVTVESSEEEEEEVEEEEMEEEKAVGKGELLREGLRRRM